MSEERSNFSQLEEEGDIAADYLEELLDICDLDGDIDIDVENGRAAVEIVSEEFGDRWLRKLVGADGKVLDALQDLTRLAVQAKSGDRSRLMLDIAGYRAGVKEALADEARVAVAKVQESGQQERMRAMNPFERKVVHDVVKKAGLVSESEGTEPNRRVVIMPGEAPVDGVDDGDDDCNERAEGEERDAPVSAETPVDDDEAGEPGESPETGSAEADVEFGDEAGGEPLRDEDENGDH